MSYCVCLIQENQIPDEHIKVLESGIHNIIADYNMDTLADIKWIVIPEGDGWTAAAPSTSSVVTLYAAPISQETRIDVLNALCDLWTDTTQCSINEIIASVIPVN